MFGSSGKPQVPNCNTNVLKVAFFYNNLVNRLSVKLSNKVLVNGMYHSRPNNLKCKSPGNLPKPNFSSQGRTQLINTSAKKTTMSQRSIGVLKLVAAVARCKTLGLPMVVGGKTNHLEQLTHFVFADQFHGLCPHRQG